MKRVLCVECGKKREPYRPVATLLDGTVTFCCRQCWKRLDYDSFMYLDLSEADEQALRRPR